jgi:hypothetical protein
MEVVILEHANYVKELNLEKGAKTNNLVDYIFAER